MHEVFTLHGYHRIFDGHYTEHLVSKRFSETLMRLIPLSYTCNVMLKPIQDNSLNNTILRVLTGRLWDAKSWRHLSQ
jgi:hypothetical protein